MKKRHAFLIAILITLLLASNIYLYKISYSPQTRETAIIGRVIDGDTIKLTDDRTIRLININTPEKSAPNYQLALNYVKKFENKSIEIEILGVDKYQRFLGRVYTPDYLNLQLVEKGLSSKFLVDKSELSDFAEAEEKAIESSLGIWQHSNYYNCLKSKINEIEEKVTIINQCDNLNISRFVLKDESRKQYVFKDIHFQEITLYTKDGTDNTQELFWNSKTNVWNDDRDSLYIFDKQGNIVHYNSYGY